MLFFGENLTLEHMSTSLPGVLTPFTESHAADKDRNNLCAVCLLKGGIIVDLILMNCSEYLHMLNDLTSNILLHKSATNLDAWCSQFLFIPTIIIGKL